MLYLPLVELLAKRIARIASADWKDLRQDGAIGLIKAIARFDPGQGVPFRAFARHYIRGAIFDSSELTRGMARRQVPIYNKIRRTEDDLKRTLQRDPTIEEIAEEAELSIEQILNAIDARGVAFPEGFPDAEGSPGWQVVDAPQPARMILYEALAHLSEREQDIIRCYYWEDQPHEEIAQRLRLTVSNVPKIRQRAIGKLRRVLE